MKLFINYYIDNTIMYLIKNVRDIPPFLYYPYCL